MRLTLLGVAVEAAPVPTVAALNPALALTVKLENVSPPKSQPAAGRSMTSTTLLQLIASAPGGAVAQPTTKRARERSTAFVRMGTSFYYPRSKRTSEKQPTCHGTRLDISHCWVEASED